MKVTEIIIPKEIILLIVFSAALNILRVVIYGSYSLIYLLWNIFLAFLPFLISSALSWHIHHSKVSKIEMFIGGLFWLLLFPNAPYIITDLIHLGYSSHAIPVWFDALVIFTSAWVGLQFAFYSLFSMEELLRRRYKDSFVQLAVLLILLFSSFGIYLGRFLRFNSWDFFASPLILGGNVWKIIIGSSHFPSAFFFTALFFCFLVVTYTSWKLSKGPVRRVPS